MKFEEELRGDALLDQIPGLTEYANVPGTIGTVISADKATLHECETIYSVEDVYLMLEVIIIDANNRRVADEWGRRNQGGNR